MGTVASLIVPPSITTPQPSALAVASSDLVSTLRVLPSSVSAPLTSLQVGDDAQSHSQVIMRAPVATAPAAAASTNSAALTGNLNASGPSSSFLAQLYGQGGDPDNITLASNIARFAPAPIYNAFVQYGYIKYRPSDAGIPQLSASAESNSERSSTASDSVVLQSTESATQPQNDNPLPAIPANDFQAYSNTQSRNQENLFPSVQQLTVTG